MVCLSITGREDPHSLDSPGGHRLQEVHVGQRCVELRHRHVGGGVLRGEALLGHEQPGREWLSLDGVMHGFQNGRA